MSEQKKTEEEIRHDIRRKFDFSEEKDAKRIDTAVEMEKDRFKAVQKKQAIKEQLKDSDEPVGKKDPAGTSSDYSLSDIRALNKVHDDDVEAVTKFAKSSGKSIAETMKNPDLKAILDSREERHKTLDATNTGTSRRKSSKPSGERLIEDFEAGKTVEDTDGLAKARMEQKKNKHRKA